MKDKIARTKKDFEQGILRGKTIFPFGYPGQKNMTMKTPVGNVEFPIEVYGLTNNKITDYKIVEPAVNNFTINGDTVIEKPLSKMNRKYQMGGSPSFNQGAAAENEQLNSPVDLSKDENGNELTFSQAFAKAKQEQLAEFVYNGESFSTGIKPQNEMPAPPTAEPMSMEDEMQEEAIEVPSAKRGMNVNTSMYGKNWPVGDEMSANTRPYKYFDNKRHYGSRGNRPMSGNEFLDKTMMYGQNGTYLPKAQDGRKQAISDMFEEVTGKPLKRSSFGSNQYYFDARSAAESAYDYRNSSNYNYTGEDPETRFKKFTDKYIINDRIMGPFMTSPDPAQYEKQLSQQRAQQEAQQRARQERQEQLRRNPMPPSINRGIPPSERIVPAPKRGPSGKGAGHGNIPTYTDPRNYQYGGYTKDTYATLMDQAKNIANMGGYGYGGQMLYAQKGENIRSSQLREQPGMQTYKAKGYFDLDNHNYDRPIIGRGRNVHQNPNPSPKIQYKKQWDINDNTTPIDPAILNKVRAEEKAFFDHYNNPHTRDLPYPNQTEYVDMSVFSDPDNRAAAEAQRARYKIRKNGGSMMKYRSGDVIQYQKGGRIMTGVVDGYTADGRIRLR